MRNLPRTPRFLLSGAIIVSLGGCIFLTSASLNAHAANAASNDVQYTTVLDYSPSTILLTEQGFSASSTYACTISSGACSATETSRTSLIPESLSEHASALVSPDETYAIIPTYNPGAAPTETLEQVVNDSLVSKATLPSISGLITDAKWSGDDSVVLLFESDGTVEKYSVAANTLTPISSIPAGASWTKLSADGRYLAYYLPATVSSGQRTFGVVDTTADKNYSMTESTPYWDLLTEGVNIFAFSPDSSKLLYLDDRSGYQMAYEVDLSTLGTDGLTGTPISTKQYSIEDMVWETNSTIVFSANRANPMTWSLYEYDLSTNAITQLDTNIAYNQAMMKDGSYVIYQTADANGRMTKVFNTDTKKSTELSIPGITENQIDTSAQIVNEDGVYGAYLPSTSATSTLLVWLHGGPDRQTSPDYNSYMSYGGYDWVLKQVQSSGVPVLKLDYPGSIGYGTQYSQEVIGGVGTTDASTTMQAITDFADAHGYSHIYVMGNSYGGYLALKLLTSYPNKIDGVLSASGVTDWESLLTNVPSSIFSIDFNGAPNDSNAQLYANASIVHNINAIGSQKVILLQGDQDSEVPYQQSVLMDAALTAAGKNVDYTTLAGEDHIYENPASYTLLCDKTMGLLGLPVASSCDMHG